MNSKEKERADRRHARSLYDYLASQRDWDFRSNWARVARLHRTAVDTSEFMTADPNDRIAFAVESGLFNGRM